MNAQLKPVPAIYLQGRPVCAGTRMKPKLATENDPEYTDVVSVSEDGTVNHVYGATTSDLLGQDFILYETPADVGTCLIALGSVAGSWGLQISQLVDTLLSNKNPLMCDQFGIMFKHAKISSFRAKAILLYVFPQPRSELTDDECDTLWLRNAGDFHGPNVETGCMPQTKLRPFLRALARGDDISSVRVDLPLWKSIPRTPPYIPRRRYVLYIDGVCTACYEYFQHAEMYNETAIRIQEKKEAILVDTKTGNRYRGIAIGKTEGWRPEFHLTE